MTSEMLSAVTRQAIHQPQATTQHGHRGLLLREWGSGLLPSLRDCEIWCSIPPASTQASPFALPAKSCEKLPARGDGHVERSVRGEGN